MTEKTAIEHIDDMITDVTLDSVYDRDPRTLTREDRLNELLRLRAARVRFTTKQEEAKYKRRTGEDMPKPADDDNDEEKTNAE